MADSSTNLSRLAPASVKEVPELKMGLLLFIPDFDVKGANRSYKSLKFQYNPETVTRTRQGEWTTDKAKAGSAMFSSRQERTLLDGHRGGGLLAKSETIGFKLIFDATELMIQNNKLAGRMDVLPELAFLEQVALGGDEPMKTETTASGTSKPPTPGQKASVPAGNQPASGGKPAPPASKTAPAKTAPKTTIQPTAPSELLLVMGDRRFPVVLTSLTITEQRFNAHFDPIRAECDCKFRILETQEVKNNKPAQVAFTELVNARKGWADSAALPAGDQEVQAIVKALESGGK